MSAGWLGGKVVMLGTALALSAPLLMQPAEAARSRGGHGTHNATAGSYRSHGYSAYRSVRHRWAGALQCVPFARENTGIELSGNANTWWNQAEGVYERGAKPEVGSILNFRSTGRMRMGHVAVVANVLDSRRIEIDHANWGGPGQVSRNIEVVDVSPSNDWTAVRVGLGHSDELGSVYPTYGFIYDRPDHGTMVANSGVTPIPANARVTMDAAAEPEEVAEAVDDTTPRYTRHRWNRSSRVHVVSSRARNTPRAAVYRVSTRAAATPVKPHRRHRS